MLSGSKEKEAENKKENKKKKQKRQQQQQQLEAIVGREGAAEGAAHSKRTGCVICDQEGMGIMDEASGSGADVPCHAIPS